MGGGVSSKTRCSNLRKTSFRILAAPPGGRPAAMRAGCSAGGDGECRGGCRRLRFSVWRRGDVPENFCAAVCLFFLRLGFRASRWALRCGFGWGGNILPGCARERLRNAGVPGTCAPQPVLQGRGTFFLRLRPAEVHLRACAFRRNLRPAPSFLMSGPGGRFRAR